MPRSAPPALTAAISNTQSVKDSIIRRCISVSVCSLCHNTHTHTHLSVYLFNVSLYALFSMPSSVLIQYIKYFFIVIYIADYNK